MNYLSAENLSKSYGDRPLFGGLSLGLHKGEKTALIAPNGTGKSTLLKILAGRETSDTGQVTLREGIRMAILDQDPLQGITLTIEALIANANTRVATIIQTYEESLHRHTSDHGTEARKAFENATAEMDHAHAWDYERRLKQLLDLFRITDTTLNIALLSGGEKKRLALAMVLLDEPDLLILDEPTNHLDVDMIEWLEEYLSRTALTLLMVTHDRYFLDRVCNRILEMHHGQIYYHEGNYEYFLQKKGEREEVHQTETDKARQLMKKELEWLRRMPKARTHKSKARIQAFNSIKEKASGQKAGPELNLQVNMARIGGKILEIEHLSKRYGDIRIIENFSYIFKKGERIGVIGRNGTGKTSFLNLLTGLEKPDSGRVETGQTIVFGYYRQAGVEFAHDKKVIDVVREIAEMVRMGDGSTVSASKFLEYFMFPAETQYKQVGKLSGGEKRRLNLLTVLVRNPNFLILDEPTNDLDILALNRLEEFLAAFSGCLLIVSHDRYFLDKLTDHLFVFEGNGAVRDYYGAYREYRYETEKSKTQKNKSPISSNEQKSKTQNSAPPEVRLETERIRETAPKKLNFNEKREYEMLGKEIEQLEAEKTDIEAKLPLTGLQYEKLMELSDRLGKVMALLDEKIMRWMELDERA
jgi:ATP-binding cassette subfamily F protein uup